MNTSRFDFISEPLLTFGYGQSMVSPKDGLYLFGPFDKAPNQIMRIGAIGTREGLARFREWLAKVNGVIDAKESASPQHRIFPGFGAIFGASLPTIPEVELVVDDASLKAALYDRDRYQAIFSTVKLFQEPILRHKRESESNIDVWFVVVPEDVYTYGRPLSAPPKSERVEVQRDMDKKLASKLGSTPSLFPEDNEAAIPYQYELNFHNQLKARLLEQADITVQVVRETTIAPNEFQKSDGRPIRGTQDAATLAWNLCVTTFYKTGRRPWRLHKIRDGVCYIGLVFKRLAESSDSELACCGAQMFLDSGDGVVFRGAIGAWRSPATREFHLSRVAARDLTKLVVDAYERLHGKPPTELFLHGLTAFNDEEWQGFSDAVPSTTNLVGVRIREALDLKAFRGSSRPVLRGSAYRQSSRGGFLWTRGYIPYLKTYMGRETPNPLRVDIVRGEADLLSVMEDLMGLTKLNFNSCNFADGVPVTLRFADVVGEILTAGPENERAAPLPFKHYI
ncbi:MAG: hypothetical protein JWR21_4363 [Herminiimonas sp.]|nr:hypothetical protein [Herminiimonas sp.]